MSHGRDTASYVPREGHNVFELLLTTKRCCTSGTVDKARPAAQKTGGTSPEIALARQAGLTLTGAPVASGVVHGRMEPLAMRRGSFVTVTKNMRTVYKLLDVVCSVVPFGGWFLSDISGLTGYKTKQYKANSWWSW